MLLSPLRPLLLRTGHARLRNPRLMSTPTGKIQPDPRNQLSWATAGSVQKNIPHLLKAHTRVLESSQAKSVLEVASGFGDHVLAYAKAHPHVTFQPTECDDYLVQRLKENIEVVAVGNVLKPVKLDVMQASHWHALRDSESGPFDLITVTNLVNVAPWPVTEALFKHIGSTDKPVLKRPDGRLCLYACLKKDGSFLSEADEKFDATLKARTSDFGIRDYEDIISLARAQGLKLRSEDNPGGGTNLFLEFGFDG